MTLLDVLTVGLQSLWMAARPKDRRRFSRRRKSAVRRAELLLPVMQSLEARRCLTPVAANDSYNANSMAATHIPAAQGVLANDTGSSLSAVLIGGPSHGSLTLNSDGSFVYTNTMPMTPDTWTYEAYDGSNYSNTATVSMAISSNGAAPTAAADSSLSRRARPHA